MVGMNYPNNLNRINNFKQHFY